MGQSTYLSYRFLKYINTTSFLLAHQNERRTTRTVKTQTKIRYDHSGVSKPTWKSECQFGPHLETISKIFDVKDYDVKRPCEICNNEVRQSLWKCLAFLSRALVSNRATGARNFGQILFDINLCLRVLKGIHDKKSVTYFWLTNFSLLFAADFQAKTNDISCKK